MPSLVAPASAIQFARFAAAFELERAVVALTARGYRDGEGMYRTRDELVSAFVDVADSQPGPTVLVGYSSGGWVAHAVAAELARRGTAPAGVVLLDTYAPRDAAVADLQTALYEQLATRPELVELVDDTGLSAMGRYLRLFAEWEPETGTVPTLLVAARHFVGTTTRPSASQWPVAHVQQVVDADHVSLLDQHATDTARVVAKWLTELV